MKKSNLILMLILFALLTAVVATTGFTAYAIPEQDSMILTNAELVEIKRGEETLTPESVSNGLGGYFIKPDDSITIRATEILGKDKEYIAKYTKNSESIVLAGKYDYTGFPEQKATFTFVMKSDYVTNYTFELRLEQQGTTNIGQFSVSGGTVQSVKRYDPTLEGADKWKELVTNTEGTSFSSLYRLDKVIIKINDDLAQNKVYKAKKGSDEIEGVFNNEEKTFSFTVGEISGSYALVISQEYYEIRLRVTKDENSNISMSAGGAAAVEPAEEEGKLYFTAKYNDDVVFYLSSTTEGYHVDDFTKDGVSVKNQSGFKNNTYEKIEVKDGTVFKSASYSVTPLRVENKGDELSFALTSALNRYSVVYKVWKDSQNDWVTATGGDLAVDHAGSVVAPVDRGEKAHYTFVEWKEGKIVIPLTTLENVKSNHTIYASYAKVKYNLTLNIGFTVPETDILSYEHGATVELDIQNRYGSDFIYLLDEENSTVKEIEFDGKNLRFIMPTENVSVFLSANPAHKFTVSIIGFKNNYIKETRFIDGSRAVVALPAGYTYKVKSFIGDNTLTFSNTTKTLTLESMPENDVEVVLDATPVFITSEAESSDYTLSMTYSGDDIEVYGSEVASLIYSKLSDKGIDEEVIINGLKGQFPMLNGGNFIAMDLSLQIKDANGSKTASVKDNGTVTVKIKLPNDFILEKVAVYHYVNGAYNEIDSEIEVSSDGKYLLFYANEFSPFIISSFVAPVSNGGISAGAWVGMSFGIVLLGAVIFIFIKSVKFAKKEQNTNK